MESFMTLKSTLSLLIISLLLAACAGPVPTVPVAENAYPAVPSPISTASIPYPSPVGEIPFPNIPAYPEPGVPISGTLAIPPSGYEPQPGDGILQRDPVTMDLANSQITKTASDPTQVTAILEGNLSDPCHTLRVIVVPSFSLGTININVYTVVDTGQSCIMMIKPFTASIPLGSYSGGHYSVYINDQLLGEFDA
jgi:hypothetical protein